MAAVASITAIRWRLALALGVAGLGAAAVAAATSSAPASPSRPNILVVMTDDQDVRSVRVMANVRRLLGEQGTTFTNSFASYPVCCPSRATFLTGQYAHNHGVLSNKPPAGGYRKLNGRHTLAGWLRQAGYYTVHLGKYLNGYGEDNPVEVPPGWSEWKGAVDPSTYRFFATTLNENSRLVSLGGRYQTDAYARMATEIIRRRARSPQPFFLYVGFTAPHDETGEGVYRAGDIKLPRPAARHVGRFRSLPLPRPPSLNEADVSDKPRNVRELKLLDTEDLAAIRTSYQRRLETLLAVDEAVARMVAALRAAGELERTLIVFTSDNGYLHGEHRIEEGKTFLYEPSIRVPLILRGPGIPRGAQRRQLVANVDLAPTILQATGARATLSVDGRSLLPLARDPRLEPDRDILLEDGVQDDPDDEYTAIRTGSFVYAEYRNGDRELYDLRADPHQLRNRAADPRYATVRIRLAKRLAKLRTCRGAACRSPA